ncbi:MAG TPA: alpha/beta hydrolase [bacterium]|nr:alpha/beta hydrolase [bacterium]
MEKIFIKNRKGQNISVLIEKAQDQKGLAFVMHGLGDSKDSDHIKMFAKCFLDNNYTVARFDATNTFGESDGIFEDANITNYYEDLEDVITWSKSQDFYQEPFILCGHSLGAISSAFYTENYPERVKALAPFSTVVNAELSKQTYTKKELDNWEKTGWLTEDWGAQGKIKLKWSYMEEKGKFDLLQKVDKLIMPILMIVGELDNCTPLKHQQVLFDKLPGRKELHVIKGSPHTFRAEKHLKEIYQILDKWIKSLI